MVFKVDFELFKENTKHLYPEQRFTMFLIIQNPIKNILQNKLGLKFITYEPYEKGFLMSFEIINKKKFLWFRIKYGF